MALTQRVLFVQIISNVLKFIYDHPVLLLIVSLYSTMIINNGENSAMKS